MITYLKKILLLALLICLSPQAKCIQVGDVLIDGDDTVWTQSYPLESYLVNKTKRTIGSHDLNSDCFQFWRGYLAVWEIIDNKLFLSKLYVEPCNSGRKELDLSQEFGSSKVHATWFAGEIIKPNGKLLEHNGDIPLSIYSCQIHYSFSNGNIYRTDTISNIKHNSKRMLPLPYAVSDSISLLASTLLDSTFIRNNIKQTESYEFCIEYKKNGKIKKISGCDGKTNTIEMHLIKVLKKNKSKLPKVMRVKHKNYRPIKVSILLDGYCLLYPERNSCNEDNY